MPAYYDGELFTVNMKEMPNSDPLIEHNKSINKIYASNDLDEEQDFIPVIDAIQGDGFNPLWHQVLIVFNEGFTPHQFFSDEEVLALPPDPIPKSLSSRRTKCIVARLLARMDEETTNLPAARAGRLNAWRQTPLQAVSGEKRQRQG